MGHNPTVLGNDVRPWPLSEAVNHNNASVYITDPANQTITCSAGGIPPKITAVCLCLGLGNAHTVAYCVWQFVSEEKKEDRTRIYRRQKKVYCKDIKLTGRKETAGDLQPCLT